MLKRGDEAVRDYHLYTECGLDNVVIRGISFTVDDAVSLRQPELQLTRASSGFER